MNRYLPVVVGAIFPGVPLALLLVSMNPQWGQPYWFTQWMQIGEGFGLVALCAALYYLLVRRIERRLGRLLNYKVRLPKVGVAVALLAVAVGLVYFSFWAGVDLLGSAGGPGTVIHNFHDIGFVYRLLGLDRLNIKNEQGVVASSSLCVALLGFVALRAKRGIGVALRDGVFYFAAPIVLAFEFALWRFFPVMSWHVTNFASWSVDLPWPTGDPSQYIYASMVPHTYWLLSNWTVLCAAAGSLAWAVLEALRRCRGVETMSESRTRVWIIYVHFSRNGLRVRLCPCEHKYAYKVFLDEDSARREIDRMRSERPDGHYELEANFLEPAPTTGTTGSEIA